MSWRASPNSLTAIQTSPHHTREPFNQRNDYSCYFVEFPQKPTLGLNTISYAIYCTFKNLCMDGGLVPALAKLSA